MMTAYTPEKENNYLLWIIHIIKNDSFIYKSQEHTNVQIKFVASKWVIANCNQSQLRSIKNYSDMCSLAFVSNYFPNHAFYSMPSKDQVYFN
jgi:hypothetical protein